jgi:hypothetical protein
MKIVPTFEEFLFEFYTSNANNHIAKVLSNDKDPLKAIEDDYSSWDDRMHDNVIDTGACEEWNTELGALLKKKLGSSVSVWKGDPKNDYLPPHYIVKYKDYILDYTSNQFLGYGLGNKLPGNTMKFTQKEYDDIYKEYTWKKII